MNACRESWRRRLSAFPSKLLIGPVAGLLALGGSIGVAVASDVIFSGAFDGQDSQSTAWEGACAASGSLAWQTAGTFTVDAAGDYALADAGELVAVDVQIGIYDGAFQPAAPVNNRLARVDGGGLVPLAPGASYTLVVQRGCDGPPGPWAIHLSGPGTISSTEAVIPPAWTAGSVSGNGPRADFGEGATPYVDAGLFQVGRSGFHQLADVSALTGLDGVAHVYNGPFNPAQPSENRIARVDDAGGVSLLAGRDYRLVVSGFTAGDSGTYRFVRFPPGDITINAGLSGAWFEPTTAGQGVLLEVYPDQGLVFAAWFTFDLQPPFDPDEATLGDSSQRWLTGIGAYQPGADRLTLNVSNTGRGLFDQSAPGQSQDNSYGTLELTFEACDRGTLDYDLPGPGVTGTIPLSRVVNDNVALCGALLDGPGVVTE